MIHAAEGILWFLLLINATEFFSSWLRRRRVVMALDSAMGAVLIAFGLKLAFDKARGATTTGAFFWRIAEQASKRPFGRAATIVDDGLKMRAAWPKFVVGRG
jgi:hypothetical protein